ncbi:MFS transporter [Colwellia sp. PAMC 21821]|uniref:MFS transporter n=1 Tax=Colwellia sp. PAMC 21821 TaxID=1816219 RepID=UPI0009BE9169|nr:MFS transporter [Colwellia sp. PAMC 21821]ARD45605.1 MFS transporter [Colwellia sp. PAMC 21821]
MTNKPQLNFWQIWNMCFGFMGIQFGFALQNSNVSRIFQTLGADYSNMAILWIAAPITGLIVQPIIGYFSDNTWNRLGRRKPYFLFGAIAASLSLFIMPNSPTLWVAAGMLWIMDASINVSMEPFRAFVGDMLPRKQRAMGYAMQSFFIAVASVVASSLPWMMANWFDISNVAEPGLLPDTVKFSFYAGGVIFFLAVLWTIYSTKEYSPEQLQAFQDAEDKTQTEESFIPRTAKKYFTGGATWLLLGLVSFAIVALNVEQLDKSLFILAGGFCFFAICQLVAGLMAKNNSHNGFAQVMSDLFSMPQTMKQLAFVQFFSWFPFFAMWTYTTAAVTEFHFGSSDVTSAAFNEGADWVGVLFSAYNLTSVFAAICIPIVVKYFNLRIAHMINLFLGGAGFISFLFIKDPTLLIVSMIGIGFAWASILSVPYAILANALPAKKMGLYMGIFNFFIVLPQILAASILGFLITKVFDNQPVYALAVGGASMVLAGLLTLRVKEPEY